MSVSIDKYLLSTSAVLLSPQPISGTTDTAGNVRWQLLNAAGGVVDSGEVTPAANAWSDEMSNPTTGTILHGCTLRAFPASDPTADDQHSPLALASTSTGDLIPTSDTEALKSGGGQKAYAAAAPTPTFTINPAGELFQRGAQQYVIRLAGTYNVRAGVTAAVCDVLEAAAPHLRLLGTGALPLGLYAWEGYVPISRKLASNKYLARVTILNAHGVALAQVNKLVTAT